MPNFYQPSIMVSIYHAQYVQINLCQNHLFLYQLTHNVTTDCSLNYKFSTRKLQVQCMLCTQIVFVFTFRTIYVHNMHWTCNSMNNLLSFCELLSWFKNKSFWQSTCNTLWNQFVFNVNRVLMFVFLIFITIVQLTCDLTSYHRFFTLYNDPAMFCLH